MVLFSTLRFESRVVLDGSQTFLLSYSRCLRFESRVVLDGSQTPAFVANAIAKFESRVVLDGNQVRCLLMVIRYVLYIIESWLYYA